MKYTQEMTEKLVADYQSGRSTDEMAAELQVPKRSVIAKLSSLGVYKAKVYVNKRGEQPVKKEAIIENIAKLLSIDINLLDSMEKVTKTALVLIETAVLKIQEDMNVEIQYWRENTTEVEAELEKLKKGFGIDVNPFVFGVAANAPLKIESKLESCRNYNMDQAVVDPSQYAGVNLLLNEEMYDAYKSY